MKALNPLRDINLGDMGQTNLIAFFEKDTGLKQEMGYLAKWFWDANFYKEITITFVKNFPPKLEYGYEVNINERYG